MLFPGDTSYVGRHAGEYVRRPSRFLLLLRILAVLAVIALLAWPVVEPWCLQVERVIIRSADFPAAIGQLRVIYVSDIHAGPFFSQARVNDLVRQINRLNPDLVILGGDYASDSESAIAFFQNIPSLRARLGVFGVMGNHDRTEPESNLSRLMAEMTASGVIPLVNTTARVKVGQNHLIVAGVDDIHCGFPDVSGVAAQVYADDFVVFAGHSPDLLPDMLKARSADGSSHWYDLALFGHTHGGQVNVMGYSPFSNLSPDLGARYLSGWLEENRASLLISNGVGTSVAPVRLFAPPQIHLITLKAR